MAKLVASRPANLIRAQRDGSILVARRAGSHAAISPTAISSSVTIVNAIGSVRYRCETSGSYRADSGDRFRSCSHYRAVENQLIRTQTRD
jgi:hypothetical protein